MLRRHFLNQISSLPFLSFLKSEPKIVQPTAAMDLNLATFLPQRNLDGELVEILDSEALNGVLEILRTKTTKHHGWVEYHEKDKRLHRVDGPAMISPDGGAEYWHQYGLYHREGGPAVTNSYEDGYRSETWYDFGLMHRIDGPAIISINPGPTHPNGRLAHTFEGWNQYGIRHRLDGPAMSTRYDNGEFCEEWIQYGVRHRLDGPAYISTESKPDPRNDFAKMWYLHGNLCMAEKRDGSMCYYRTIHNCDILVNCVEDSNLSPWGGTFRNDPAPWNRHNRHSLLERQGHCHSISIHPLGPEHEKKLIAPEDFKYRDLADALHPPFVKSHKLRTSNYVETEPLHLRAMDI